MTKKQKKMLARIILTALLYILLAVIRAKDWIYGIEGGPVGLYWYTVPYLVIGWDILYKAARNIMKGRVFDENFLMCIATFGAFVIGEYPEAVAVMLFYQVGELFQDYAVNRSRKSITELMDICPEYANIEEAGQIRQIDPSDVKVGDTILIKAGERVPLDGEVIFGESLVDTSALTGESMPRRVSEGAEIISGCVNLDGVLSVRVMKSFEDSTVAKILELVENASSRKARVENFITKFSRYYTPVVVIGALLLAIVPPLMLDGNWGEWMPRACIFLVISCPCALVISVPLSFFGGIGAASKNGVLVKGSNYLEALSEMSTIVFDKTGTLTKGEFKVSEVRPVTISSGQLLELAALAEGYSNHPIAKSIRDAYGSELDMERVQGVRELSGHGLQVVADGREVLVGNAKLMARMGVFYEPLDTIGTVVYVARENIFIGAVIIEDIIKEGAYKAIQDLKAAGVKKTIMLTGDKQQVGEMVASEIELDDVYAELLPGDKVRKVEDLLETIGEKEKLTFVGDGINDAPVLTRADIGIAMGSMGSDAAIEAADIVLMDDDISKISLVVRISRGTIRIVKQNIVFALGVKALVLIFGALGIANMWGAVFADVGVSVIAILNAMRALRIK